MIKEGDELSVCFFSKCRQSVKNHLRTQGCLKYPETSIKDNPEPVEV